MDGLWEKMKTVTAKRDELRTYSRRAIPEEEREQVRAEITSLTSQLKELRKEVRLCGDIKERSHHMEENMEAIDKERGQSREVRRR